MEKNLPDCIRVFENMSDQPVSSRSAWYLPSYVQSCHGNTQLHRCMNDSTECNNFIQHLIDATWPASLLDIRNDYGMTALHLGSMGNRPDRIRQFLVAGANPLSKDNWGCIPLHYASTEGNIDVVIALTKAFNTQEVTRMQSKKLRILDLSLCLHKPNNEGEMPLHLATEYGHLDIIERLINLGAKLDSVRPKDGYRPLDIAIMKGYKEITEFILNYYKNNPTKELRYQYCYRKLQKPLKLMGLARAFRIILKIPQYKLRLQSSSDSE